MGARVAMMVWNTCENDSRVIKEATTLAGAGYEVTVVCLKGPGLAPDETRDGVRYLRVKERLGVGRPRVRDFVSGGATKGGPLASARAYLSRWLLGAYRLATLRIAYRTMRQTVPGLEPDVIHAHDLQTLPAAVRIAAVTGSKLVYDSHELASEVSFRPPGVLRRLIVRAERKAIKRAHRVVTVSPGIADHLAREYTIARPELVYNAPPTRAPAGRTVRDDLRLGPEVPLALYVGAVAAGRGLEQTIDAIGTLPEFHLAVVGPREAVLDEGVRERALGAGCEGRVHLLEPVSYTDLVSYLSTADVGVIATQDLALNHRYTMPNKLFETVLAGVPVVVSDLPHLRAFVEEHGVGKVAVSTDVPALAEAIREVAKDPDLRPEGERLERLRAEFGWGAQGERLTGLYSSLIGASGGRT